MARGKKREKKIKYFDYNLLFLIIFLLFFGLVMLYSSSYYTAINTFNDGTYFLKHQLRNIILGAVCMVIMLVVDYHVWRRFAVVIYVVAFAFCAAVDIPGVGTSSHGSSRWIQIGPINFQPSEVAKVAVIIFLAALLERSARKISEFKNLAKVFLALLPIVGVVALGNLSTAIIVCAIAICMLFVASPKYSHFFWIGGFLVGFAAVFVLLASYRLDRVKAFLHPDASSSSGYQTLMGLYAIGSGGVFGKGLGNSLQKLGNVPETQNDMIFSIICEELGLFGATCLILLFILLLWRMMVIVNNAPDLFGALLVTGVMAHIGLQVVLNIAVVTNTIPNTGVILPFISYGGSSTLILLAEMGLVLNVSKGITLSKID